MPLTLLGTLEWFELNSTRKYPLKDGATALTDGGSTTNPAHRLPDDVLADLHIWYESGTTPPAELYIGSVSVSERLATVTIAYKTAAAVDRAVAAVSVVDPEPGRVYQLRPLDTANSAGWITFGVGIKQPESRGTWRFSGVAQSGILARCAKTFSGAAFTPGVKSVRKKGTLERLRGVVVMKSATPQELIVECVPRTNPRARHWRGKPINAVVIRLNSNFAGAEAIQSRFLGPCDQNPESGTCRKPPIYSINAATPDCNGQITIRFREDGNANLFSVDASINPLVRMRYTLDMMTYCSRSVPNIDLSVVFDPCCYTPIISLDPNGPFA